MQESIGQVIRRLRKEHNVTQEELAAALGVTAQAVSKWENNVGIPDVSQFVPIANLFDVSIDTLFSRGEKNADEQVKTFIEKLDSENLSDIAEFKKLSKALQQFPNHPNLLERIVWKAFFLVKPAGNEQCKEVLTTAVKAADSFIRNCKESARILWMKARKVDLLSRAGCYAEAEILAKEFNIPIITEHMYMARICREKKEISEEIRHRQESIAQILGFLAHEITELGTAYQLNDQTEEALQVHSIHLKLPFLIHEKDLFHAPLQNSHFMSGFDAAYCLVLLERYDEAVDLLEKIFEYAAIQCECCNNHTPLISPLLCNIDMKGYHGNLREEDYLWKIKAEEFAPLYDNPKFQTLLHKYENMKNNLK